MRCSWVLIFMVACGGSDGPSRDDGELGGHCYPNGSCNVGLSCSAGLCAAIDAGVDAPVDSAPDASLCNNDSAYEPNGTISTAYDSGVAVSAASRTITSLAICPSGDVDIYAVTITTANTNFELLVDFDAGDAALSGAILNSSGIPIANATPVSGMPQRVRAYTLNLPVGIYYADVRSATGNNYNYSLTLNVTGP